MKKISLKSDYSEGAHPKIMQALYETNEEQTNGYGNDPYCASAKEKIKKACKCPNADVHFLVGGSQTNSTLLDAMLNSYEGVISPKSGHIVDVEAGTIEAAGHKIFVLSETQGKLSAQEIFKFCDKYQKEANYPRMIHPGVVYLTQPTEYGGLYSYEELLAIRTVCDKFHMRLYIDGARLLYALASKKNNVSLPQLCSLCDAFYIGGTKCGCLFGEAVVIPKPESIPGINIMIKQHGALLAKGRLLGVQFDTLFTDDFYLHVGEQAIQTAQMLYKSLCEKGYSFAYDTFINQLFAIVPDQAIQELSQIFDFTIWQKVDCLHTMIRITTSWGTSFNDIRKICEKI